MGDGIEYSAMDLRFYPVSAKILKWGHHTYSQIFILYSLQWCQWETCRMERLEAHREHGILSGRLCPGKKMIKV